MLLRFYTKNKRGVKFVDRAKVIETILKYPDSYLSTQSKSLEHRIENIQLSKEEYKRVVTESNMENTKRGR